MKISRLTAAFALLISAFGYVVAQNGTTTPYSAYGFGVLRDHATSTQRSMGGVGYAMNSGRQINAMNPASHAAIDSLTFLFDFGLDFTNLWQTENQDGTNVSDNNFGGGLDYATMQFPLGRYMGGAVGLLPYSSVGYSFGSEINNGIDTRQGSGSLNELYVAVAGQPFKGFTIGANISYLFGTIINETYTTITSSGYQTLSQRQLIVRDFHLNFGAQYSLPLNKGDRLTVGLTYSPAKTLLGTGRRVDYDTAQDSKPEFSDEHSLKNQYSLPETWGAGINYQFGRKVMVEFDYTYQPWSKAKFRGFAEDAGMMEYADRSKFALGAQYTPDVRGAYYRCMTYRLGAFWSDDYMKLLGNQLREYGVSCGFGFPVPNFKTTINLGIEWMCRQARPNQLIKENYLNITLGVNFNEMWFRQSKIY
ncbi:MAG: hypothetical protein J1F05_03465 [Muribaculaceae bacterium]|nr:hypothetical protein [Muribaculaceae bacterium]